MSRLGRVVRSGAGRRRLQGLVIALVTLAAVTSAVVAGALLVASHGPFDQAFAARHGAHLTARVDAATATTALTVPGVAAVAGPFPDTRITLEPAPGLPGPQLAVVGRAGAGGPVDQLSLLTGRWPAAPGEVALSADFSGPVFAVGSTLTSTAGARLTVVGVASSVTHSADAWVLPAAIDALRPAGSPPTDQLLYRTAGSTSPTALRDELAAALPAGALLGTQSALDVRIAANQNSAPIVPFLLAFGSLGLGLAVLVVASVVSGAVAANTRRIGILKSLGFTPAQVVRGYLVQALLPAAVGTALGLACGDLAALPFLQEAGQVYGTGGVGLPWWIDPAVAALVLAVVALAALAPALRAGRLSTVAALTAGRAPRTGRGLWAHRLAARLPLPRAVGYGLAGPFTRPLRTLTVLSAALLGTVTATFAVGLTASATAIGSARDVGPGYAVTVDPYHLSPQAGPDTFPTPLTPTERAHLEATVRALPGTSTWYGVVRQDLTVTGLAAPANTVLYFGDSLATGYPMLAGHWLDGPDQVVVPEHFLTATGHHLGDTLSLASADTTATARIVGESFNPGNGGMDLAASVPALTSTTPADQYFIAVRPGVPVDSYITDLRAAVDLPVANTQERGGHLVTMVKSMATLLTLLLVCVAALGVLNTLLLDTRERVHDLGVCKAVGMTPRQLLSLVLTSTLLPALLATALALPLGIALHHLVLTLTAHALDSTLPAAITAVYHPLPLTLLALTAPTLTLLGTLPPATWAARLRTATALRTE
ncbi:FtsX-like permease family protein [Kitasatospora sp. NPDC058965]|uniref:FtsX-like permease family protein n=1 Tax=Kitasatospora sp. NPDC058965 TaxID=3346682 RepID=UPI00369438BD